MLVPSGRSATDSGGSTPPLGDRGPRCGWQRSRISSVSDHYSKPNEDLRIALASVARAIADSLEVREVWERVAEACRMVVPFDAICVTRLEPEGRVRVVGVAGASIAKSFEDQVFARADFSTRHWPDEDDFVVIVRDTKEELDPSFRMDASVLYPWLRARAVASRRNTGVGLQSWRS